MKSDGNIDKFFGINWKAYARQLIMVDVVFALVALMPYSFLYFFPKIESPFNIICMSIGTLGLIAFLLLTAQIIINYYNKASFKLEFFSTHFKYSWPGISSIKSFKCDYNDIEYIEVVKTIYSEGGSTEDAVLHLKNGAKRTIDVVYGIPWKKAYKEFQERGVVVKWHNS